MPPLAVTCEGLLLLFASQAIAIPLSDVLPVSETHNFPGYEIPGSRVTVGMTLGLFNSLDISLMSCFAFFVDVADGLNELWVRRDVGSVEKRLCAD